MKLQITAKEAKALSDQYDITKPKALYRRCLAQIMACALSGGGTWDSEVTFPSETAEELKLAREIVKATREQLKSQGFKISISVPSRYSDEPEWAVSSIHINI